MFKNYGILRISVVLFKILSALILIITLISTVGFFVGNGAPQAPRWWGIATLIVGLGYAFTLLVTSEIIRLLLDIKEKLYNADSRKSNADSRR